MNAPEYRFLTEWQVPGTPEEVSDVLADPGELPRWWPAVYLEVEPLCAGDEQGVGRRARLRTKGWLPYTLEWELSVTESRRPFGFSIEARGDLAGSGVWTFEAAGAWTRVTYDWRVCAEKPLLRILSPLFRPLLAANHDWAMRTGEESLRLELARRRCGSAADLTRIAPPPATTTSPLPLLLAGAALGAAAFGIARVLSRRRRRPRRFWR